MAKLSNFLHICNILHLHLHRRLDHNPVRQIRAVFQDSALGFTLVDSSLERTIDADQLEVNATTQVGI